MNVEREQIRPDSPENIKSRLSLLSSMNNDRTPEDSLEKRCEKMAIPEYIKVLERLKKEVEAELHEQLYR